MNTNYTPLSSAFSQKRPLSQKSFDINVVFISLIAITLVIMAVLLIILIQKKLQELAYIPTFI